MTDELTAQFIIDLNEPELDEEKTQRKVQNLLNQLRQVEGVERVERTQKPESQEGERGFGFLIGLLTAEVNIKNIKTVLKFISDRLGGKTFKIKVKVKDKEVEMEASSQEELLLVQKTVDDLLKKLDRDESNESNE